MQTITLTAKARPTWQEVVSNLSPVQRLVHLAVRYDSEQTDSIRGELTRARLRAYNDELSIQARRAGCNRQGELTRGPALTALNEMSKEDAAAIERQYNLDLASQIMQIGKDTPSANRNVYAARLREWEGKRAEAKAPAIAQWTENSARAKGFEDFHKNNRLEGTAHLEPEIAVCPVCQGWVNRGEIPLKVASNNPPPYHRNCPHFFQVTPEKVDDCTDLFMG